MLAMEQLTQFGNEEVLSALIRIVAEESDPTMRHMIVMCAYEIVLKLQAPEPS